MLQNQMYLGIGFKEAGQRGRHKKAEATILLGGVKTRHINSCHCEGNRKARVRNEETRN